MKRDAAVGRNVETDQFAGAQLIRLLVVEVDVAVDECALESRIAVATRTHRDVACGAGKDRFRVFERRTAPPAFDEQGISGFGQRAFAEVGAHQHRVFVLPADIGLGLG